MTIAHLSGKLQYCVAILYHTCGQGLWNGKSMQRPRFATIASLTMGEKCGGTQESKPNEALFGRETYDFTFGCIITVNNDQVIHFVNCVDGLDVHYEGVNASVTEQTRLELGRFGRFGPEVTGRERGYTGRHTSRGSHRALSAEESFPVRVGRIL
jgi:hypothetical protein